MHRFGFLLLLCVCVPAVSASPQFSASAHSSLQDSLRAVRVQAAAPSYERESVPVHQITRERLDAFGRSDLSTVLNEFSGVSIRDYGGVGGIKTLNVRNMGSAHTTVVYDGLDMGNMQNSQVDLGRIPLEDVDKIRLEMGGGDELFRTATQQLTAGLLLLNSRQPHFSQRPYRLSFQLSGASFATWQPHLRYEQKFSEDWSMRLNGNFLYSRGDYPYFVDNGAASCYQNRLGAMVHQGNASLDVFGRLGRASRPRADASGADASKADAGTLRIKLMYAAGNRGIPGPVILYAQDPTEQLWNQDIAARVQWNRSFSKPWRVQLGLNYALSQTRYTDTDPTYSTPQIDFYHHPKITLDAVVGYVWNEDFQFSFAQDLYGASLRSNTPYAVNPLRLYSLSALSAKFTRGKCLARITLGLHYLTETLTAGSDKFHFSPSASFSYQAHSQLLLRVSYKNACRMPTFNDLYYARVGNRDLRPERAHQCNLGAHWESPWGLRMSLDTYCNVVRDKIVAIPTLFVWKMYNLGQALIAGVDINAHYERRFLPCLALSAQAKYSYQYAVDCTDPQRKTYGLSLPYTPAHNAAFSLNILTRWLNVAYSCEALSERYSTLQPLASAKLLPYVLHSLSINHKFALKNIELYVNAALHNLGNVHYEWVKYYPMPGRNFKVTLRVVL